MSPVPVGSLPSLEASTVSLGAGLMIWGPQGTSPREIKAWHDDPGSLREGGLLPAVPCPWSLSGISASAPSYPLLGGLPPTWDIFRASLLVTVHICVMSPLWVGLPSALVSVTAY